jgi:hypothetical protein
MATSSTTLHFTEQGIKAVRDTCDRGGGGLTRLCLTSVVVQPPATEFGSLGGSCTVRQSGSVARPSNMRGSLLIRLGGDTHAVL